jgi:hypothetical protein
MGSSALRICSWYQYAWSLRHFSFGHWTARVSTHSSLAQLIPVPSPIPNPRNQIKTKPTFRLIHIIPRALAAQNVLDLLLLQVLALVVALVDDEVVRAR